MVGDLFQPVHLLFVLAVALLVLGPKRLPEVGKTLGSGIRDFRDAISGESHPSAWVDQGEAPAQPPSADPQPWIATADPEPAATPTPAYPDATPDVQPADDETVAAATQPSPGANAVASDVPAAAVTPVAHLEPEDTPPPRLTVAPSPEPGSVPPPDATA